MHSLKNESFEIKSEVDIDEDQWFLKSETMDTTDNSDLINNQLSSILIKFQTQNHERNVFYNSLNQKIEEHDLKKELNDKIQNIFSKFPDPKLRMDTSVVLERQHFNSENTVFSRPHETMNSTKSKKCRNPTPKKKSPTKNGLQPPSDNPLVFNINISAFRDINNERLVCRPSAGAPTYPLLGLDRNYDFSDNSSDSHLDNCLNANEGTLQTFHSPNYIPAVDETWQEETSNDNLRNNQNVESANNNFENTPSNLDKPIEISQDQVGDVTVDPVTNKTPRSVKRKLSLPEYKSKRRRQVLENEIKNEEECHNKVESSENKLDKPMENVNKDINKKSDKVANRRTRNVKTRRKATTKLKRKRITRAFVSTDTSPDDSDVNSSDKIQNPVDSSSQNSRHSRLDSERSVEATQENQNTTNSDLISEKNTKEIINKSIQTNLQEESPSDFEKSNKSLKCQEIQTDSLEVPEINKNLNVSAVADCSFSTSQRKKKRIKLCRHHLRLSDLLRVSRKRCNITSNIFVEFIPKFTSEHPLFTNRSVLEASEVDFTECDVSREDPITPTSNNESFKVPITSTLPVPKAHTVKKISDLREIIALKTNAQNNDGSENTNRRFTTTFEIKRPPTRPQRRETRHTFRPPSPPIIISTPNNQIEDDVLSLFADSVIEQNTSPNSPRFESDDEFDGRLSPFNNSPTPNEFDEHFNDNIERPVQQPWQEDMSVVSSDEDPNNFDEEPIRLVDRNDELSAEKNESETLRISIVGDSPREVIRDSVTNNLNKSSVNEAYESTTELSGTSSDHNLGGNETQVINPSPDKRKLYTLSDYNQTYGAVTNSINDHSMPDDDIQFRKPSPRTVAAPLNNYNVETQAYESEPTLSRTISDHRRNSNETQLIKPSPDTRKLSAPSGYTTESYGYESVTNDYSARDNETQARKPSPKTRMFAPSNNYSVETQGYESIPNLSRTVSDYRRKSNETQVAKPYNYNTENQAYESGKNLSDNEAQFRKPSPQTRTFTKSNNYSVETQTSDSITQVPPGTRKLSVPLSYNTENLLYDPVTNYKLRDNEIQARKPSPKTRTFVPSNNYNPENPTYETVPGPSRRRSNETQVTKPSPNTRTSYAENQGYESVTNVPSTGDSEIQANKPSPDTRPLFVTSSNYNAEIQAYETVTILPRPVIDHNTTGNNETQVTKPPSSKTNPVYRLMPLEIPVLSSGQNIQANTNQVSKASLNTRQLPSTQSNRSPEGSESVVKSSTVTRKLSFTTNSQLDNSDINNSFNRFTVSFRNNDIQEPHNDQTAVQEEDVDTEEIFESPSTTTNPHSTAPTSENREEYAPIVDEPAEVPPQYPSADHSSELNNEYHVKKFKDRMRTMCGRYLENGFCGSNQHPHLRHKLITRDLEEFVRKFTHEQLKDVFDNFVTPFRFATEELMSLFARYYGKFDDESNLIEMAKKLVSLRPPVRFKKMVFIMTNIINALSNFLPSSVAIEKVFEAVGQNDFAVIDALLTLALRECTIENNWSIIQKLTSVENYEIPLRDVECILNKCNRNRKFHVQTVYDDVIKKIPDINLSKINSLLLNNFVVAMKRHGIVGIEELEKRLEQCREKYGVKNAQPVPSTSFESNAQNQSIISPPSIQPLLDCPVTNNQFKFQNLSFNGPRNSFHTPPTNMQRPKQFSSVPRHPPYKSFRPHFNSTYIGSKPNYKPRFNKSVRYQNMNMLISQIKQAFCSGDIDQGIKLLQEQASRPDFSMIAENVIINIPAHLTSLVTKFISDKERDQSNLEV